MVMPKFNDMFSDVLLVLNEGDTLHRSDILSRVIDRLGLTEAEKSETMSAGGNRARSRVSWSLEFLCQAGAAERPSRGYARITELGRHLLTEQPGGVTLKRLRQTDGLKDWKRRSQAKAEDRQREAALEVEGENDGDGDESTPLEKIENSINQIESAIATQLLERIRAEEPVFLERTVLELLHAMGYGNSKDDLTHTGGSGDGGVDGLIRQDRLGLEQIYIQAKRYGEGTIGRPQIQNFVGALSGKGANRGVFITTSRFTAEARDYVKNLLDKRIVLIDGEEFARLMIANGVGVVSTKSFKLVEIDENFFEID
jgi:restriction system protein